VNIVTSIKVAEAYFSLLAERDPGAARFAQGI
jgi:hypothetical protein